MNLEEAIEGLNSQLARYKGYELPADEAIQLGIEALERFEIIKETPYIECLRRMTELTRKLPSETE